MTRLDIVTTYINESDSVVDVGCDQAHLGVILAGIGMKSIACDIKESIIESARNKINALNLSDMIDLRVSDGLNNIKAGEADTLVLCGMGTYTILEILEGTSLRFKKIITISNNNHDILKLKMNDLNYIVNSEEIIYEKGKYYNLIVFVLGHKERYTQEELYIGINHKNLNLLHQKLRNELLKYKKIYESNKDSSISDIINTINNFLEGEENV